MIRLIFKSIFGFLLLKSDCAEVNSKFGKPELAVVTSNLQPAHFFMIWLCENNLW